MARAMARAVWLFLPGSALLDEKGVFANRQAVEK